MIKLDVTLRRCDEIADLEDEIARLNDVILSKEQEIHRMGEFGALYLQAFDQLKQAKLKMDEAGLDTSFIKLR